MNQIKIKYRCRCCNFLTLDSEPGCFDICSVCYWEDDNLQKDNPDYAGGANEISLNEARKNYKKLGAISEEYKNDVRLPLAEEI